MTKHHLCCVVRASSPTRPLNPPYSPVHSRPDRGQTINSLQAVCLSQVQLQKSNLGNKKTPEQTNRGRGGSAVKAGVQGGKSSREEVCVEWGRGTGHVLETEKGTLGAAFLDWGRKTTLQGPAPVSPDQHAATVGKTRALFMATSYWCS